MLKLKISILLIVGVFGSSFVFGQNVDSLINYYQQKADKYLIKHNEVRNYFRIDWVGVHTYSSAYTKSLDQPEFSVHWKDLENFKDLIKYADRNYQIEVYKNKGEKRFGPQLLQVVQILKQNHPKIPVVQNKPMAGIKIAIDPGHIAGDWKTAVAESRFVELYGIEKEAVRFFEGELTLSTAFVLRDSLERLGAEVMLTREKPNFSALDMSYEEWKQTELLDTLIRKGYALERAESIIKYTSPTYIYRKYFLDSDLDARADKINYFKPNFTIVIHFNADADSENFSKPSKRNYSMVFVPGSYLAGETRTEVERFDFLRTLLTDHLQESTKLSEYVMDAFEEELKVPAVRNYQAPAYLTNLSMKVQSGVYARNLRLNRLLNTPVCYGESLLQDNILEAKALKLNDLQNGIIAPRVVEVANAYLSGIKKYVEKLKAGR